MQLEDLKWDADGLLPVVIIDEQSGEVLTLAHANREALERTIAERSTYLFSRSRRELWHKGATSGNTQKVVSVAYDCDGDSLLYRVRPSGPACHTGERSCFHANLLEPDESAITTAPSSAFGGAVEHLDAVLKARKTALLSGASSVDESYVAKLFAGGVDRIGKKIGEEATEVVIAAKNNSPEELVWESSDLLFHLLVLLEHFDVPLAAVGEHLLGRAKPDTP
ncbi:MAG: bifunctional phosphoribosyl-AMP cyclohydrolase/phosphoribosyl-ATP diphosphatase HisIE [Candidatus Eremiobacteraeota bacterium]|nr:bifunctional phosphoribosyl-AMP cyclohydrolase/phosphoribosyl-ATP diphosphatase HisIE [Candidatus Eremiobacteraeota bacterium]